MLRTGYLGESGLPVYRTAVARNAPLSPDALPFYVLRRALEDLAVDVRAVLREHSRAEDAATLDILTRLVVSAVRCAERDADDVTRVWRLG